MREAVAKKPTTTAWRKTPSNDNKSSSSSSESDLHDNIRGGGAELETATTTTAAVRRSARHRATKAQQITELLEREWQFLTRKVQGDLEALVERERDERNNKERRSYLIQTPREQTTRLLTPRILSSTPSPTKQPSSAAKLPGSLTKVCEDDLNSFVVVPPPQKPVPAEESTTTTVVALKTQVANMEDEIRMLRAQLASVVENNGSSGEKSCSSSARVVVVEVVNDVHHAANTAGFKDNNNGFET